ncbi:MAG: endonuclease/exonuclease/phosphatase family protein [Alphaproteobacteria bacterium]
MLMLSALALLPWAQALAANGSLKPISSLLPDGELRIISWNVQRLSPLNSKTNKAGHRTPAQLSLLADMLDALDADMVFLQEISSSLALRPLLPDTHHAILSAAGRNMKQAILIRKPLLPYIRPITLASLNNTGTVRDGIGLAFDFGAHQVSVLGVHLKSSCHQRPLSYPSAACKQLQAQLKILKNWISARIDADDAFIIVGDFNRRLDLEPTPNSAFIYKPSAHYNPLDWMWPALFDENASGYAASLVRPNRFQRSKCHHGKYQYFIDHMIMNELAAGLIALDSFKEYLVDLPLHTQKSLSDHCPIGLSLAVQ